MKHVFPKQNARVLAIMPGGEERERLSQTAEGELWEVEFCAVVAEALHLLHFGDRFAAILLDKGVAGDHWETCVRDLAACAGGARIVLASESVTNGLWERVVEQGGHDVVSKPLRDEQVCRAILHALWYATTVSYSKTIS